MTIHPIDTAPRGDGLVRLVTANGDILVCQWLPSYRKWVWQLCGLYFSDSVFVGWTV